MANRSPEREEFLADTITTAVEGGIGYWSVCYEYKWLLLPPAQAYAVVATIEDTEGADEWIAQHSATNEEWLSEHGKVINVDLIARGIGRIKRNEVTLNPTLKAAILLGDSENDAGQIDSDAADVIVQAGLFNEIVYG